MNIPYTPIQCARKMLAFFCDYHAGYAAYHYACDSLFRII